MRKKAPSIPFMAGIKNILRLTIFRRHYRLQIGDYIKIRPDKKTVICAKYMPFWPKLEPSLHEGDLGREGKQNKLFERWQREDIARVYALRW